MNSLFISVLLAVQIPLCFSSECCEPEGIWSEWMGSKASCLDYCGGVGTYPRTRTCLTEKDGCPCSGSTKEDTPCNETPCSFPRNNSCVPGKVLQVIGNEFVCATENTVTPVEPAPATCEPSCCPINGIWSEWGASTTCSATCGACGMTTRTRTCLSDSYGCPCTGASSTVNACATNPCNSTTPCCSGFTKRINRIEGTYECQAVIPTVEPQPEMTTCCDPAGQGLWNKWTPWSQCSATCGLCGMRTRTRTCASQIYGCGCVGLPIETEPCGGLACNSSTPCCSSYVATKSFDGASICVQQEPPTVTGTWTEWEPIAGQTCNDTCGACGRMMQKRMCLPAGSQCTGEYYASAPCGFDLCGIGRATCCSGYEKAFDSVNRKMYCKQIST